MIENESITISDVFDNWIENCASENTRSNYARVVPDFFKRVLFKPLPEVTKEDLESIKPLTVDKRYKQKLLKEGMKQSTVIYNLKIVSSFFGELEINDVFRDLNYLWIRKVVLSQKKLKDDTVYRKKVGSDELDQFKDWLVNDRFAQSVRYARKGIQYSLLVDFMWVTASRISAVFNVQWKDIKFEEDGTGQKGYTIYIHDKGGKINKKPISDEFYSKLTAHLKHDEENAKVFAGLSQRNFTNLMKEYCELFDKEFTPHGIKKGAVTHLYNLTHDIVLAQRFADHEDPKTTIRYIQSDPSRSSQGSYILSNDINYESLKELSREQLLELVLDRQDVSYQLYQGAKRKNYI